MVVVLLAYGLLQHHYAVPHSNRRAMLFALMFMQFFWVVALSMRAMDTFPGSDEQEYEWCWQSDERMRALEREGWWAKYIRLSGVVVGFLGGFW